MKGTRLEIEFGADLKEIKKALSDLKNQAKSTGTQIEKDFKASGNSTGKLEKGLGRIKAQLAGLVAGASVIALGRSFVQLTDKAKGLEAQLRLVTKSEDELKSTMAGVQRLADETRSSLSDTISLYARLARSSKNLNVSQEQLLTVTKAINQAGTISGGDLAGRQAALVQLSQGLASGVLRGEELNSVLEQTPRLAEAIAAGMGIPFEELRKEAAEGKITTEQIINALIKESGTLEKEFEKIPKTAADAIQGVNNEFEKIFFGGDNSQLVEALEELKTTLSDPAVKEGILSIASALVKLAAGATETVSVLTNAVARSARTAAAVVNGTIDGYSGKIQRLEDQIQKLEDRGNAPILSSLFDLVSDGGTPFGAVNIALNFDDAARKRAIEALQKEIEQTKLEMKLSVETGAAEKDVAEYFEHVNRLKEIEKAVTDGRLTREQADTEIARTKDQMADLEKRYEFTKLIADEEERIKKEKEEQAKKDKDKVTSKTVKIDPVADESILKVDELNRRLVELNNATISTEAELRSNYAERLEIQKQIIQLAIDEKEQTLLLTKKDEDRVKLLTDIQILKRDIIDLDKNAKKVTEEALLARLKSEFDRIMAEMQAAEQSIEARQSVGDLTQLEAEAQIAEVRARNVELLKEIVKQMKALAQASSDPALVTTITQMETALNRAKEESADFNKQLKEFSEGALADAFEDILTGAKSVEDAFKDMAREIARIIIQIAAQKAAAAAFAAFHTGGVIGHSRRATHNVNPAIFQFAPRYHSGGVAGLKPNEIPAVLERGEEVLTASDPRHRNNLTGGGNSTKIVNVLDPSLLNEAMLSDQGEEIILNTLRKNGLNI